jgi:beta-lactamase regulating signal transducer with metallopeptidase domain
MITYIIKSSVSLIILYGFFHVFLRPHKILIFNRFYLVSSLVFSMIIPLINIPIKTNFPLTNSLGKLTLTTGQAMQSKEIMSNANSSFTYQNILIVLFIIISTFLLIRFAINIFRIIRKTIKYKKIGNTKTTLVLVEEETLPYSFFKYIFVNKSNFENGKIEKKLLMHEEVHCLQYHSVDIILLELINLFFWFNPSIWLFRNAIQTNHEYCADDEVLARDESYDYYQLLLNLVIRNNTTYLVSNFKYSLIKNRLIMMTSSKPLHNAIVRKIAGVLLILIIAITYTLCQVDKVNNDSSGLMAKSLILQNINSDQWWKPIVKKHGINSESFTVHQQFVIFGKKTIQGDIESFTDVVIIQNLKDSTYTYRIFKSKVASYDTKNKLFNIPDCTMNIFEWKSKNTEPLHSWTNINYKVDFIKGGYGMSGGNRLK